MSSLIIQRGILRAQVHQRVFKSDKIVQEAILKNHLINTYYLCVNGTFAMFSAERLNNFFTKLFNETITQDRKQANEAILRLREQMAERYSFYFPSIVNYPSQYLACNSKAVQRPAAILEFEKYLQAVLAVNTSSSEYVDLTIEVTVNPIKDSFMNRGGQPWHSISKFLDDLCGLYKREKRFDDMNNILKAADDRGILSSIFSRNG